jgi:hypothetical protein
VIPLAGSRFIIPGEGCGHFDTDYGSSRIDDSDHSFVDDSDHCVGWPIEVCIGSVTAPPKWHSISCRAWTKDLLSNDSNNVPVV